ncbi:MAG: hypothetical protein F6J90_23585 [Moorea sp. SIOASIH]|uniref:hypothetical protein n=1 Tax=Moorena sp. SIOASIH TaxID=2607817 RepID=UPI0013BDB257|nr:hypothetical protein [Moorena sp. SIOASIH]NEO39154.1 hypothetical protein [Moorena sp. SIOASIH]
MSFQTIAVLNQSNKQRVSIQPSAVSRQPSAVSRQPSANQGEVVKAIVWHRLLACEV